MDVDAVLQWAGDVLQHMWSMCSVNVTHELLNTCYLTARTGTRASHNTWYSSACMLQKAYAHELAIPRRIAPMSTTVTE